MAQMSDDRAQDLNLLRETAQEAAKLALSFFGQPVVSDRKPDGSPITEADKAVDALLAARLRGARPDYGWLSEESAEHEERLATRRVWVLDPIDGTRAFIKGLDDWTVALSLVEDGKPVLAVIVNPVRGEVFEAQAGMGALLNGRRILAGQQSDLAGARLVVPAAILQNTRWSLPWPAITPVWANSIVYRLALVASANAEASFALMPKWEWDVAPGALLVSEAGGVITDAAGSPLRFNSAEAKVQGFLAAAPKLHQMLLERLSGALKGPPVARRA
jgi:myo-inositol-1(or 4)-monophosphatase